MSDFILTPLDDITIDPDIQQRVVHIDDRIVSEYADVLESGGLLPAVVAFQDGDTLLLADGFHRYAAHGRVGRKQIPVAIIEGTRRDAVLYAVQANLRHGLRPTQADRRKAVETLLRDPEWSEWSDREIARRCGVSPTTVGTLRRDLDEPSVQSGQTDPPPKVRTFTRSGKVHTMATENIGGTVTKKPKVETTENPDASSRKCKNCEKLERLLLGHKMWIGSLERQLESREIPRETLNKATAPIRDELEKEKANRKRAVEKLREFRKSRNELLPNEIREAQAQIERDRANLQNDRIPLNVKACSVKGLSKEDVRLLRNALHPDRMPEEMRDKADKALAVLNAAMNGSGDSPQAAAYRQRRG